MPGARCTSLRRGLAALLLAVGILATVRLGDNSLHDAQPEASPILFATPELHIRFGRSRLIVDGITASADHEAALLAVIAEQFDGAEVETDFRAGVALDVRWETITTRLLYLVAATASAHAVVNETGGEIRGIAYDPDHYKSRLQFLREALEGERTFASAVVAVDQAADMPSLCERHFAAIVQRDNTEQAIRFRQSSTTLSGSALPLLDRLAEFAYDCRDHRIAVVGYTDATGPADWNLRVSAARAQAVADELVRRGVPAQRLLVEGRGAQSPLAGNDTVQGRARNRRIEFELR